MKLLASMLTMAALGLTALGATPEGRMCLWNRLEQRADLPRAAQSLMPLQTPDSARQALAVCRMRELRSFANQVGYERLDLVPRLALPDTLSTYVTQGRQQSFLLMLEPDEASPQFEDLVCWLEQRLAEYDLCSERMLLDRGSVADHAMLVVGERSYAMLIVPEQKRNLSTRALAFVKQYVAQGGIVLVMGEGPTMLDGRPDIGMQHWFASDPRLRHVDRQGVMRAFESGQGLFVQYLQMGQLLHHRRQTPGAQLLMFYNASTDEASRGTAWFDGIAIPFDIAPGAAQVYWLRESTLRRMY